jgi:hypothetical protein
MDSSDMLSCLATTKISDGSWRGATKAFLLNWIDKLRLFHELTPVPDRPSESVQRTLLQNAVLGLDMPRQVQISSELQKATTGTVITFAQCKSLLINAAAGYDKQSGKSNPNGKSRRSAFSSEIISGDKSGFEDDTLYEDVTSEFCYDVDTMPGEIRAYAANQRERPQFKPGSRMPIGRWKALSEQAQKAWDTMEDDDKAKILALQETRKGALPSAKSKFSVNTHTVTDDMPPDDLDDILLAMVTKQSNRAKPNSHPADVRSVLSQPIKAAKAQVTDEQILINGHAYVRQVHTGDGKFRHRAPMPTGKSLCLSEILVLAMPTTSTV